MYLALLYKTRELYIKEKKLDKDEGVKWVQDGVFGAMMQVALVNDGPVTFEINTPTKEPVKNIQKGVPKGSAKGTSKGTPESTPSGTETPSTYDTTENVENV
jgi:D-tyrosyl-tRNA(Tyr) deacylase